MTETVRIERQFRGPADSGNGGYVCGLLAEYLDGCAEVRLQAPPPLDRDLSITRGDDSSIMLMDGLRTIATARPGQLALEAPPAPSEDRAIAGSKNYAGFDRHWFPGCFVCGTDRKPGDGLRIFAGCADGSDLVLSPWVPHRSLDDGSGLVAPRFIWAALDCPGAFAAMGRSGDPLVLGTLTVEADRPVPIGENCIIAGWMIAKEGRKHYCGTAIYSQSGEVCARGKAIWIRIDAPDISGQK